MGSHGWPLHDAVAEPRHNLKHDWYGDPRLLHYHLWAAAWGGNWSCWEGNWKEWTIYRPRTSGQTSTIHLECPERYEQAWESFISHKTNVSSPPWLNRLLVCLRRPAGEDPYHNQIQQRSWRDTARAIGGLFCWEHSGIAAPKRAYVLNNAISIYIRLTHSLGPENGMYVVYPGSHNIRTEEELRASRIYAREVHVRSDQVLVASSRLWLETVRSGGGIVM